MFVKEIITSFIRLGGRLVGVVANNLKYTGGGAVSLMGRIKNRDQKIAVFFAALFA